MICEQVVCEQVVRCVNKECSVWSWVGSEGEGSYGGGLLEVEFADCWL